MRTTVTLDDDVAAAVERLRHESHLGLSEALNQLARAGLATRPARRRFVQRSLDLQLRVDATNIAEVLEILDGPGGR